MVWFLYNIILQICFSNDFTNRIDLTHSLNMSEEIRNNDLFNKDRWNISMFWKSTDPISCSVVVVGFENFITTKNQWKVLGIVDWIADRMGRTTEAVFVFLKAEEYSVEILRKENRNTLSPTMVKLFTFSITD